MTNPNRDTSVAQLPRLLRGKARMKQIAAEAEAERKQVEAELLSSLGREVTPLDRVAAEQISAAMVRARRLRAAGRDDFQERKQILQATRAFGFKPAPVAAQKPTMLSPLEYARAKYGRPSVASDDDADAHSEAAQ